MLTIAQILGCRPSLAVQSPCADYPRNDRPWPSCQSGVWSYQGLGVGQAWQDVTAQRALGVTYTNNTAKPILVFIGLQTSQIPGQIFIVLDGIVQGFRLYAWDATVTFVVPPGGTYVLSGYVQFCGVCGNRWLELR